MPHVLLTFQLKPTPVSACTDILFVATFYMFVLWCIPLTYTWLCHPKASNNNNNNKMKKWAVSKVPKAMKAFVYVYNTILLVLGITKENFNPWKPSRMVFSMHYNRVFYKFPGRSLLWTTTVVHDYETNPIIFLCISKFPSIQHSCMFLNAYKHNYNICM